MMYRSATPRTMLPTVAQVQPRPGADIEALKISFITRKLQLTPEEAQRFWPVFNQLEAELKQVRQEKQQLAGSVTDWSGMPESSVKQHISQALALEQKELDVKKKYTEQLFGVLPAYKVGMLYQAVEEFKRKILEMAQQRRQGTPGGRF